MELPNSPTISRDRTWVAEKIALLDDNARGAVDTPLYEFPLADDGIRLYVKDESAHPTGSLKYRLARSLFRHALASGWILPDTHVVEASSGSTAVAEAHLARRLGLSFTAVLPASTSRQKLERIKSSGGVCHLVRDPAAISATAQLVAAETGGHFMDQFTFGERATDWRGDDNIAAELFRQLEEARVPAPAWIVVGAGTGTTATTIGRYLRCYDIPTNLCVVDPPGSAYFPAWFNRDPDATTTTPSRIEGIGRPRVEPSFVLDVVDRVMQITDADSIAAMRFAETRFGRSVGPSTGTNLFGALCLVSELRRMGRTGSVVTLICDRGDLYADTYGSDAWLSEQGLDITDPTRRLTAMVEGA